MHTKPQTRVGIVIVSWNCKQKLRACLNSLAEHSPRTDHRIVVVDNGSSDGTVALLRHKYPDIITVDAGENLGFAKANNYGASAVAADYYLFLNPDTIVPRGTVDDLAGEADADPAVGIVAPKLTFPDGALQPSAHRRFPGFVSHHIQYNFLLFTLIQRYRPGWDFTLYTAADHNNTLYPKHVMGAAMLIPATIFRSVGGFDESFFLYLEETDLCFRIHQHRRLMYYPRLVIEHHMAGSSGETALGQGSPHYLQSIYHYFRLRRGRLFVYWLWLTTTTTLAINLAVLEVVGLLRRWLFPTRSGSYRRMGVEFTKRALTWHLRSLGGIG